MLIDNKYNLGQYVYLKTDPEQQVRIITDIRIGLDGGILYTIALGADTTNHYELEISKEKNNAYI